ncbi:sterigmatocystin biosynthesis monooxygenase stcW [Fusarium mundagurra]|uniref:Sterigmatocystin biosynthesis monooxygenase stcW n=1 Tax=Fusarium mundagurra TaxID=1567541 RepID=A0A8H6DAG1_9HYPO|nr:sterigmatocystin biosynthesis monooxygenase stcW [Fusarium mundagurra]
MAATAKDRAIQYYQSLAPGPAKPGEATEAYKDIDELAYHLSRVPTFTSRPLKIIAVGAGLSGLALARAVHVGKLQNVSITIYEKNAGIGGTWYENRYPGCACDIPASNYAFSWAPNPHWPSYYASGKDIHEYIESVATQHNLRGYVKTGHKVVGAQWLEDHQTWRVTVNKTDGRDLVISSPGISDGETETTFDDECDVFINCSGFFNNWKWPKNVADRSEFQGKLYHTAAWPQDAETDLDGKTVALIGNGSSGVQVLPAIIDRVKKVYVHIRSPTWVTTSFAAKFAGPGGANYNYTEEQKLTWSADPAAYLEYRRQIEKELNSRFGLYIDHTPEQKAAREFGIAEMTSKLRAGGKEELLQAMLPDFAVGCRRTTPGNGYLEALCHPKCEVIWGKVDAFTADGLTTSDGTVTSGIDAIICATGFDLSCAPRFPIIGRNGVNLREQWLKNPHAYLSVTATDMPNYFTMMGPNSPLGHGSIVTAIEMVTKYICNLIHKLQTQNYSYVVPKAHIAGAYQKHALAWLRRTAWASHCASTYKNGTVDGDLNSLHPGSRLHYFELLSAPRYEDFEWQSLCDSEDMTFAWLATGFTAAERSADENTDLTWYLEFDGQAQQIKRSSTD